MNWDEIDLQQVLFGSLLLTVGIGIGVLESVVPSVVGSVLTVGLWSSVSTVSVIAEVRGGE